MKLAQDVCTRLQQRLLHECRNLQAKRNEMAELSSTYNRYVDLDRQLEVSRQRVSAILGLLGPVHVNEVMKANDAGCLAEFPAPKDLRKRIRLWRAVREYLRMAGESKVGDIQEFLNWLGMENVTRQAIESALKRHNDSFDIKKKGRERYVALKK